MGKGPAWPELHGLASVPPFLGWGVVTSSWLVDVVFPPFNNNNKKKITPGISISLESVTTIWLSF